MDGLLLEQQSWGLYTNLSKLAYSHSLFEIANPELKKIRDHRLLMVAHRAFLRWERRVSKFYNYNPDGADTWH